MLRHKVNERCNFETEKNKSFSYTFFFTDFSPFSYTTGNDCKKKWKKIDDKLFYMKYKVITAIFEKLYTCYEKIKKKFKEFKVQLFL